MKKKKQSQVIKSIRSFMVDLCIALIIVAGINSFLVQNLRVEGKSMFPLVDNGNMVLINKMAYAFNEPKRGDIIGFYNTELEKNIVKRVVGIPGDEINFIEDMLYVNNEPVALNGATIESGGDVIYPYRVPQGTYFVLGDNYNQSIDSRYGFIGGVEKEEIIGRIDFRLWPLQGIGFLKSK